MKLIGPFSQIIPLSGLPMKGPMVDEQLEIIVKGGIVVREGQVISIGKFDELAKQFSLAEVHEIEGNRVLIPGFIDCHTHICFAGNRSRDYAMRVAGRSYLDIAKAGGGIWDSVQQTRQASVDELAKLTLLRAERLLKQGTTTIEVKSGYGLDTPNELKMLRAINQANHNTHADLIATCLAAHMKPRDYAGSPAEYLQYIADTLLPIVNQESLTKRVDIFVEESAFGGTEARSYLQASQAMGFAITVHADQFTASGTALAVELNAVSADHLEASGAREVALLAQSDTVAVALPGASLGLGMGFTPARNLLDAGACVAIASDWNPGSAPMGDLLTQAAVFGAYEKLSLAETLSGLTFRPAKALGLQDRGTFEIGKMADMQAYDTDDYRDIFYNQGALKASTVWKRGVTI